jgi:hypothetical protein
MLYSPLLHGSVGILDELLLFGAPLIVAIIILVIASRRARAQNPPRERVRPARSDLAPDNKKSAQDS